MTAPSILLLENDFPQQVGTLDLKEKDKQFAPWRSVREFLQRLKKMHHIMAPIYKKI